MATISILKTHFCVINSLQLADSCHLRINFYGFAEPEADVCIFKAPLNLSMLQAYTLFLWEDVQCFLKMGAPVFDYYWPLPQTSNLTMAPAGCQNVTLPTL